MDAIARFAGHVVTGTYEGLPASAVAAVKTFVLDSLGVAVAGSGEISAGRLATAAARWGRGGEATVWGAGRRLPAPSAALVNAYQTHCLEFDCVHDGAVVHPMATILPALLAYAERTGGLAGRDLLTAVALAVDVTVGIGVAARAPMRFFRPALAGAFGAVAGLGKLAGLDTDTLTSAFGILYGQLSGTLQPHLEGSPVLALQMGVNARAALTALDLATADFNGPREVLEGRYGYYALFEGAHDLTPVVASLGTTWRVTELAHKPFPSGRLTHGAIDGLQRLRTAHGFSAEDVREVRVTVPPLVARLVGRPDLPAPSASYAKLCLPFVAATALLKGSVDVPDFGGEWLRDTRVHDLARRVTVESDGTLDDNASGPQIITVTLNDGRRHEARVERVLGNPANPLSRARHLDKFRRCWTYGASPLGEDARDRLIALVERLEDVGDVRELIRATVP